MQPAKQVENVQVDVEASAAEVRDVEDAFARAGFAEIIVRADQVRRSTGLLPWIVAVTIGVPVKSFFDGFFATPGERAYDALGAWVKDIWRARHSDVRAGSISIEDPDGTTVILSTTIPDEAIAALADLDWDQLCGGYLIWNAERREWQDVLPAGR
jgi:hypothetical protein